MKCILLCAGYATRLFPLTENFPKALLEVGGKPIINYVIDEVNTLNEVDEIYLVTNNKYTPHFQEWADKLNNVKPITVYNDKTTTNENRLGAIGDIEFTIEQAKIDDDVLIIATDNLFTFKLRDFVDFQKQFGTSAICVKTEEYEDLVFSRKDADLEPNVEPSKDYYENMNLSGLDDFVLGFERPEEREPVAYVEQEDFVKAEPRNDEMDLAFPTARSEESSVEDRLSEIDKLLQELENKK